MSHLNATSPTVELCQTLPPSINSRGIFIHNKSSTEFLTYYLPLLELQMGIILMTTYALNFILQRFGFTMFTCEVLAGIVLGPTFLGRFDFMREVLFPMNSQDLLTQVGSIGFTLFIFISAAKVDTEANGRSTRKLATVTGIASVLVPIGLGSFLFSLSYEYLKEKHAVEAALNVIINNSFSTFSMVVHILEELKLPNSELGMLCRSSSMVSGGIGLAIAVALSMGQSGGTGALDLVGFLAYIVLAIVLIKPIMLWKVKRTPQGASMSKTFCLTVVTMALITEIYFQLIHQLPNIGAFALGFIVPAGAPLGSALVEMFDSFIYSVMMPIYIVTTVIRADLSLVISDFHEVKLFLGIIMMVLVIKVIACLVPSLYMNMPFTDSLLYATMMTSRGTIEIALYKYARDSKVITEGVFSLSILYTLLHNIFIAMYVRKYYDPTRKYAGYEARNIMSLKNESNLRILACVHKPENIISITRLIDAFHPSKERSITLCALHLVKLVGRSSPIIVSHQKQKPQTNSSSHNMIISFNQYEQSNWGKVSISSFTAISPSNLMNEDISVLALDQLASLIVLPLHRRWSIHGILESEDKTMRTVNCKVLEKCPCSVGVFFDRGGKLGRQNTSTMSLCMLFLGGKDDREALSLAKRISKDPNVHLTVIHFVSNHASDDAYMDMEEEDLDAWALENTFKQTNQTIMNVSSTNVEYKKMLVNDGPDTAMAIHSIADEYDFFLVGRRYGIISPQTSGLSDWTELSELGIIGDMLASSDITTKAAVLVVQQQRKLK